MKKGEQISGWMMLNEKVFRRVAAPLANQTAATEDGCAGGCGANRKVMQGFLPPPGGAPHLSPKPPAWERKSPLFSAILPMFPVQFRSFLRPKNTRFMAYWQKILISQNLK
jgi:hypothetical protein